MKCVYTFLSTGVKKKRLNFYSTLSLHVTSCESSGQSPSLSLIPSGRNPCPGPGTPHISVETHSTSTTRPTRDFSRCLCSRTGLDFPGATGTSVRGCPSGFWALVHRVRLQVNTFFACAQEKEPSCAQLSCGLSPKSINFARILESFRLTR